MALVFVSLLGLFVGIFFSRDIEYAAFRLFGSPVDVGSYRIDVAPGWMPVAARSAKGIQTVVLERVIDTDRAGPPRRLTISNRRTDVPDSIRASAPRVTRDWGVLVLLSPNASFDGIADQPRAPGVAVFQESLSVGYSALDDLAAVQAIRHRAQ